MNTTTHKYATKRLRALSQITDGDFKRPTKRTGLCKVIVYVYVHDSDD